MSVTDEIKNRLDIVDIISEQVQLRRSGRNYAGFCPFHPNTKSPAFYVFPETQTWHCFGACGEGGDVFTYVMKQQGWDFKEALQKLAQRAGVTLRERSPEERAQRAKEKEQSDLLTAAADYFHQLFLHAPQAAAARRYVADRGLHEATIAEFQLGFALDSWEACRTHFNSQGYKDDELLAAGLLTENPDSGRRYDRFRNRLMIPIWNGDGRLAGFGARTLEKEGLPKYLNSPQTDLFDKSHLLYGLDKAKRHIREARQVVVVEGYMDVMQGWQAGYRNLVAQMGTALTEHHLRQLKRITKRFVLALDADAAGQKATMRGLQVARQTLDKDVEVRFDARGLIQQEGRLQADIRIVTLPAGQDPDNIIQADPEQWPQLLAKAQPVVAYVIAMATVDLDLNDAKAKTAVAQQVIPLIKDIPDPVERDHYWQALARALRVDERALRRVALPDKKTTFSQRRPPPPPPHFPDADGAIAPAERPDRRRVGLTSGAVVTEMREQNYLRQILHRPQLLLLVDQRLRQHEQAPVAGTDFATAVDRELFYQLQQRALLARTPGRPFATIAELCDSLDEVLAGRLQSWLAPTPTEETELERLADTLVLSVLDWRLEKAKRLLSEVKLLFHEAQHVANDAAALELYKQQLRELPLIVLRINKAKSAMSAVSRRKAEESTLG